MLIKALTDYYDMLASQNKILPDGYSKVNISYVVSLTADGDIADIIDYQEKAPTAKGKSKESPRAEIFPLRTEKTAIENNIIEHRAAYIFGLVSEKGELAVEDRKHQAFREKQLEFLDGLDTPLINAFRLFVEKWQPAAETENKFLLGLGNKYAASGFAFCLNTASSALLHNDPAIKEKWEKLYFAQDAAELLSQCAVTGEQAEIARLHSKIKGVIGGQPAGTVLVSYKNPSEESYGNTQSYNSNISQNVMKKYTEALNYLLSVTDSQGNRKYVKMFDDTTVIYWAMNTQDVYQDLFEAAFFGDPKETVRQFLDNLLDKIKQGTVNIDQALAMEQINPKTDFYLVGIKPNSSRLALKFIYHRKFDELIAGALRHQQDLQIGENTKAIALWQIKKEMLSPKSTNDQVNPALAAKLFESIVTGSAYPQALLETTVRRCKTDKDINYVRAGAIKACVNRNARKQGKKEELTVALDKNNFNEAYLCGRLFAVLEKIQQAAYNDSLNRTIKDSYFSSASTTPAIIFPKLLKLAEYHLAKIEKPSHITFYRKLIQEIIGNLPGEFPKVLSLTEQGKFMIGYYQQYESLFSSKNSAQNENAQ